MRVSAPGRPHLTYCTNIHPGESWDEVRRNLERYVLAVKARVSPDEPFGVGLRLSSAASRELGEGETLRAFKRWLDQNGLYVFTLNGFPYGDFHRSVVKESVYRPDWLEPERVSYTNRLASQLAVLLPDGVGGTVSTVPGAFRARVPSAVEAERIADHIVEHVATLHRIHARTGRRIELCLEPEPCCFIETVKDTVEFFRTHLQSARAAARLAEHTGASVDEAGAFLQRHVGVCFDACHMAVEFEQARTAIEALQKAGIRIGKVQLSAGLCLDFDGSARDADLLEAIERFDEPVYLHQVVERANGAFERFVDLRHAIDKKRAAPGPAEWRVHFHVPIFHEELPPFESTRSFLGDLLAQCAQRPISSHLEVETYTWDVLPPELRDEPIEQAIARELRWVVARLK